MAGSGGVVSDRNMQSAAVEPPAPPAELAGAVGVAGDRPQSEAAFLALTDGSVSVFPGRAADGEAAGG